MANDETHHAMRQIAEIALPLGNDVQTVLPVDDVQYNTKGSNPPFALTEQTGGLKILDCIFLAPFDNEGQPMLDPAGSIPGTYLSIYAGSILDFEGDCIVNAANTGGISGFGVDEMINRACGEALIKPARRNFNGIPTGEAKVTPSFQHKKVHHIIHAVGPVFRANGFAAALHPLPELQRQLFNAYQSALFRAVELDAKRVGYALLSAGVFRGQRPLDEVLRIGLHAIATTFQECVAQGVRWPLKEIAMVAYTPGEQEALTKELRKLLGIGKIAMVLPPLGQVLGWTKKGKD